MYNPVFPTWNGDIEVWKDNKPQTEIILLAPDVDNLPILMQYTGLKDSTGKLIFEGDIVEHNGTNKVAKQKPLVFITFKDGCFCLTAPMKACESIENISNGESMDNSASIRCVIFEAWSNDCELKLKIIGNIFENPDLLRRNVNE
jgi:uncharacterized phage protein (TIGR01671 family)